MQSACCNCGCGDEPEKHSNGQYLAFTKGHNGPGHDAKTYIAAKLKLINAERARIQKVNAAAQREREAAYGQKPKPSSTNSIGVHGSVTIT